MATTIALKGANPAYFPNVNAAGLPILNQKALDAVLTKYGADNNQLNASQYRDNYNKFGWNVKSDGSAVLHGAAAFGISKTTNPMGGYVSYKGDFNKAAQQLGVNLAGLKTDAQKYDAINNASKDYYIVANALDRTGVAANNKSPHASVLFKADGQGNLVPVVQPNGELVANNYQAVGVSHAGWQGQLAELAPLIGMGALAFGAPYLTEMLGGAGAAAGAGAGAASGGLTAGLTLGEVGALGGATIPGLSQIGQAMLQGSLISGGIAAVTGGDIGRAMLTGALTGGASSVVSGALASGALGSIAQSFGPMGNAIATGAIVSAGQAAFTGQPWLKAGLIGGLSSGIMYQAVDWAKEAFSKPPGAQPGTLVVDKNGNVVQIDADGKGVYQKDMFGAVGKDQTVTIADKAGNIVNTTDPNIQTSPIYNDAIANGSTPPTVGLSQTGEINGMQGTATYYTNGQTTWTPFGDGSTATQIIPSDTPIKSEVVWQNGVPKIQQVIANGSSNLGDMSNSYNTEISYNGQSGNLSQYKYGDEVVYSFKPTNGTSAPVDLTDDFAKGFVDTKGNFIDSTGAVRSNLNGNYVDSSGQVYDTMGNPVAKLADAIHAPTTIDWSGTLKDNGTIVRTNGEVINVKSGSVAPGYETNTSPNYVDKSGTLYDQYGNPSKSLVGNYVDNSGQVYDQYGNPAGSITPGSNIPPGTDLSGILNNNGTITKTDGSVIDYTGKVITPPTVPKTPTDPTLPATIGSIVTNKVTQPTTTTTTPTNYKLDWGTPPTINQAGVNPGIYAGAVKPYYADATANQNAYYWGKHPYAATEADLANYNNVPNAPVQPFGPKTSAVGGTDQLNIADYTKQYLNPTYNAGYLGSQPQYAGSGGTTTNLPAQPVAPTPIQQPIQQPIQTIMPEPIVPYHPVTVLDENGNPMALPMPEAQPIVQPAIP